MNYLIVIYVIWNLYLCLNQLIKYNTLYNTSLSRYSSIGSLRMYERALGRRLNKYFETNDCMEILCCIYSRKNLIQFRTSETEL